MANPSLHPRFPHQRLITGFLMLHAKAGDKDAFVRQLEYIYDWIDKYARRDEVQRIESSTLDADTDVWSKDDSGKIIPLTERIKQLNS